MQIKIRQGVANREKRVKIYGWVQNVRRQGDNLMFIELRDGTGYLQAVLNGNGSIISAHWLWLYVLLIIGPRFPT